MAVRRDESSDHKEDGISSQVLSTEGRRIALVHDWLNSYVGGERVLEQMIAVYPAAELFVAFDNMKDKDRTFLAGKEPVTSFLQGWSYIRKNYTRYLPLLTVAIEQLDVTGCDLVLSSSSCIGKGVLTSGNQLHISYVHSPMRYAWDMQHQYLRDAGLSSGLRALLARLVLHHARLWDQRTANGVDHFVANSRYIAQRIWRAYRREAKVIYPPVDVEHFKFEERKGDYYLAASRLVPYKKMLEIVRAFALLRRKLVVIGEGPQRRELLEAARGSSWIEIMGFQPSTVLRDHMRNAKGFVFAAEEDFGITPVEAQACGTPVIAYRRGGVGESVRGLGEETPTGVFFDEQTPEAIARAVESFEANESRILPVNCRANAERFSIEKFRHAYVSYVEECWESFVARGGRRL